MSNIKLSVCCVTYNHAQYLEKALDSVITQNVDFEFEIIIGDDYSTDGSRTIIEKYGNKYPRLIKTIFQHQNSRGKKNFGDVINSAKGEYIIILETDDYWTDSGKLQRQVDFLDSHPNCIAVAHQCLIVDENSKEISRKYPSIEGGWYSYKDFRDGLLPGQTATLMYRNPKLNPQYDMELYESLTQGPGDLKKIFCLLANGRIYTLSDSMSAYRHVTSSGYSFSATHKRDDLKALDYFQEIKLFSRKYSNIEMRNAADVRLLQTALAAYKAKNITFSMLFNYIRTSQNILGTLWHSCYNILKIKKQNEKSKCDNPNI